MTDKELRRMSRSELLEMLLMQIKENEILQEQLSQAKEELDSRRILVENSGSIAEAALKLNRVFEAADEAAKQYLDSVRGIIEKENGME